MIVSFVCLCCICLCALIWSCACVCKHVQFYEVICSLLSTVVLPLCHTVGRGTLVNIILIFSCKQEHLVLWTYLITCVVFTVAATAVEDGGSSQQQFRRSSTKRGSFRKYATCLELCA